MAKDYKPTDVVTVVGISKSLIEWAAELGTPVQTIISRLKRGKSIDDAVSTAKSSTGGANRGKKLDADVLSVDEVRLLLESGNRNETWSRDTALIVLAYRSGLRCAEILALQPKDADLERSTISVHHGKGDKARVVALDPAAVAYLVGWVKTRMDWGISAAPLFCTRAGGRLDARQVRAMFQRRRQAAGITKHAHPHGMRRTMASEMAAEGIPLIDISGALGHSNVATTNTYLKRVSPTSVLDAMKSRSWGGESKNVNNVVTSIPAPEWLAALRDDVRQLVAVCTQVLQAKAA
jgi:integrase